MSGAISASQMLMIGSMGAQAIGAYGTSRANKQAAGAQAQIARNNAQIAQWQADDALARGDKAVQAVRLKGRQLSGTQRARLAQNGVDVGTGSALEILTDTAYFTEIDAATTHDNAAREAWALRNQAMGFTSEASLMQNRSDAENPLLAAGTSLLGSAGKVAASWYGGAPAPASGVRTDFSGVDYQKRGDY